MALKIALLLLALPALAASPGKAPNFTCVDGEGLAYKIWIGGDAPKIQVLDKTGKSREIRLSGENVALKNRGPEDPRTYNTWNPDGADMYTLLDLSNEFVVSYSMIGGAAQVQVSLAIDFKEKNGLNCKTSGYAVRVVQDPSPTPERFAQAIAEYAKLRTQNGPLLPEGVLGVEAMIRRLYNSIDTKNRPLIVRFLTIASMPIKSIDSRSVEKVFVRLPSPYKEFWKSLLNEMQYDIYPFVNRYATWIVEGANMKPAPDHFSMAAGFGEFVNSSGFRDKDVLSFFVSEVTPVLKGLSEDDSNRIRALLPQNAERFFLDSWGKSIGRKTLADFADIENMANEMKEIVSAKEFEPGKIQKKFESFLTSTMAAEPEARAVYIQSVGAIIKKLSPRQKEDLTPWLEDPAQKRLYQEMMK